MSNRPRIIAAVATLLAAGLILLCLVLTTVAARQAREEWPPKHLSEIEIEEFAEIIDLPQSNAPAADIPAPAPLEQPEQNLSEPTPESGHDMADAGDPAEAPAKVTSRQPSPVKTEKKKPAKTGPSAAELKKQKEEEEARRRATANTKNAFANAAGNANAKAPGKTPGQSGAPSDCSSALNGRGTGRAGGGWMIPAYAKVPSTVTGSVRMEVKIDRQGRVRNVRFIGGDAPAATDPAVRRAVEAEVRARNFTRSDDNAPDEATAYITYTFK